MEIEPLPRVTFLPAQLTQLVIQNWTGDIIDYQKNGQICKVFHGQGTCVFKDGHEYKGELRFGLLHGKGTFKWTDGTLYKGEFRENEITGKGTYHWSDGSTYKGQVMNGLRHGQGTYINTEEGVEYEGQWVNGMRDGYGELRYKNGSVYQGNWENNKRNGHGTMNWVTSNEKYTGNWVDNLQSGFGTHIWLDSSTAYKLLRNRYVGYWHNGLRHGKGTFYYSNGSKYEGDWIENYKQGEGKFTFEDGTEYEGPFEKDRMVNRVIPQRPVSPPLKKGQVEPHSPKTKASLAARKEVEANPYKRLLDISDLTEYEQNPADVEKEVQNIMLRYNSELKAWYNKYARKVEATKSEESFAMTLR